MAIKHFFTQISKSSGGILKHFWALCICEPTRPTYRKVIP